MSADKAVSVTVSAVNVGPCIAGLTRFSHSVYSTLVYGAVTGKVTDIGLLCSLLTHEKDPSFYVMLSYQNPKN